jgi:diguanylate cyclase (GGDEF)-like protein
VLIVDDEEAARIAIEEAVRQLGYECRSARDGIEAWRLLQQERADIILSDWHMPRMDGLELCRRTRTSDRSSDYTYFIFMTCLGDKAHFLRGMEAGADDYYSKPLDLDELRARLVSAGRVIALYRDLADRNAALQRDSQASFRAARLDALTHVANRFCMEEDLRVLWSRAARYSHRCSIAIGDIDLFKQHNDRFGHVAADEVLRRIAHTIRDGLREGDSVYRYGGEEFVVVLPDQGLAEATAALDRVRAAVERLAIPGGGPGAVVTISFGAAQLDHARDTSTEDWLRRADAALYRAKARGRNRVEADGPR